MKTTIDHIGIAVKDLEKSNQLFTKLLGTPPYKIETVETEGIKISFFQLNNIKIELLESVRLDSPISKFIKKRGEGIHHLAFEVDNVIQSVKTQTANGFVSIQSTPKKGADNKKINFLHPHTTNKVLIELCQKEQ